MIAKRRFCGMTVASLLLAACAGAPPDVIEPAPATSASASTPAPSATPAGTPVVTPAPPPPKADPSLIPRETLVGNPDHAFVQVSPDGKQIAFLAPVDGVMNVWVGPVQDVSAAKPVTKEKVRGIRRYDWAYTNAHILYLQDHDGDENWRLFVVDLKAGNAIKDLTPVEKAQARLTSLSSNFPDEGLVGLNDRDPKVHDAMRINIKTGERKLVLKNELGFTNVLVDDQFNVRLVMRHTRTGGMEFLEPTAKKDTPPYLVIGHEDSMTTSPSHFDSTGKTLFLMDSRGRNTSALFRVDFKTKKPTLLAEDKRVDIDDVLMQPKTNEVQAVAINHERVKWQVLDKTLQPDFDYLGKVLDAEFQVISRSLDDKVWIVVYRVSDGPARYYVYQRGKKPEAQFLFTSQKSLEGLPLAKMHSRVLKARDGLELVSYLTVPKASDPDTDGKPDKAVPMVLLVHGGPWGRDQYGYNPMHQWLANRGYAVLAVNFRGSTGFGKGFVNAADKEWAAKMHDDLLDAVKWAVDEKIADPTKIAIMGGSYGGYATLVGLTFTPDTFACGVDIVGPSKLQTLLESVPEYWKPMLDEFTHRIGDHRTEEGRKFLASRSPLTFVEKIKKPLLIGQGANDPRVKQAESDQIVKAMQEKHIPVTYVLYPDEGHGFARAENRLSFNAVAETFLAQCLGGPYEPIGDDFKGSTIAVPAGAEGVYGLKDALSK